MTPLQKLHDLGQSIWIDNITRDMLDSGELSRYLSDFSVTGLTSNPTIFEKALSKSSAYDEAIAEGLAAGRTGEELFLDLALADLKRAADLFQPIHERTSGVDGWVSLEVSPLLAYETNASLKMAKVLFARGERNNLHIKIPGTKEGLPAIEEATFAGVPINITLLFSREHYLAAADAWLRGIERRIEKGLDPDVRSVASLFVSRWDRAVADDVPSELKNTLGIAVAGRTYAAARELHDSPRWRRALNAGARLQRVLWASTGTKDPDASDVLYPEALATPYTVNTMPQETLHAFADHGKVGEPMPRDGGDCEEVLAAHAKAGIDVDAVAAKLQKDGAKSFSDSWKQLLERLEEKEHEVQKAS
ncbi:MAG: transaldolase [Planctomycetota bacterium]